METPIDPQYERALELVEMSDDTGEQKSEAWLRRRLDCTTASDVSSVFEERINPFKSRHQFIVEKVKCETSHFSTVATCWGDKYESVVVRVYEDIYEHQRPDLLVDQEGRPVPCRIWHMGLLTTNEFTMEVIDPVTGEVIRQVVPVGASIDGLAAIRGDTHLLEIKAPYARVPYDPANPNLEEYGDLEDTGFVKRNYWMQTQTQMAVTHIDLCAFFDTQFRESVYEEDEIVGVALPRTAPVSLAEMYPNRYYGYILSEGRGVTERVRYPMDETHGWPRIILDPEQALTWCFENARPEEVILRWDLVHYMLHRVHRDQKWFDATLPQIGRTWNEIMEHRRLGTLPEKPARKKKEKSDLLSRPGDPSPQEKPIRKVSTPRITKARKAADPDDLGLPDGIKFPGPKPRAPRKAASPTLPKVPPVNEIVTPQVKVRVQASSKIVRAPRRIKPVAPTDSGVNM